MKRPFFPDRTAARTLRHGRIGHGPPYANTGRGLDISLEKLAALARLDRTYVSGIERGERNVAVINIVKIALALNVPPSELLSTLD